MSRPLASIRQAVCAAVLGTSALWYALASAADAQSARFYEDALQRFERRDLPGAILQLKNALQIDPNMLAAQVLLGKALLANGEPGPAELNLAKALTMGADRAEVVVPLAQAYATQGKASLLLERIGPDGLPPRVQIEVLILRGNAEIELGNVASAERTLREARALDERSVPVRIAQANLYLRLGQIARAAQGLDEVLKFAPNDASVWNLRASVAHLQGDLKSALDGYTTAVRLDPEHVDAQVALAGLLLDLGRDQEADRAIAAARKVSPHEPRVAYLRALSASRKNDSEGVREALNEVVSVLDRIPKHLISRHSQLLVLGGLAHYGLGNPEKASEYLALQLKANARDPGPAKLLASIYLDRGDAARALSVLEPLQQSASKDAQLLSLLAAAQMRAHRPGAAVEVLEQAVRAANAPPNLRVDFGVSLVQNGQAELGMKQLAEAFQKDPQNTRAGALLTTLYLKRKQPDRALAIIQEVVRRDPRSAHAQNLLGVTRAALGDEKAAKQAYEAAVAIAPRFTPAALNLARLDAASGARDAARNRLQGLLKSEPANADAMYELARLEEQSGEAREAIRWLERAMGAPRERVRAGILLTEVLIRQQDIGRAVGIARDLVLNAPKDGDALFALARAELANGNQDAARQALTTLRPLVGFDPARNVQLARLYLAMGDRDAARYGAQKALEGDPGDLEGLVLLTELDIASGDFARAEQDARNLKQRFPNEAVVLRLAGDQAAARGQLGVAITNYQAAVARDRSPDTALRLYWALAQSGETAKAVAFLEQYAREHPEHASMQRAAADANLRAGNLVAARARYEKLLEAHPDDADLLNNLAQVTLRQGDRGARRYAERAYALARSDAAILDTFGWVLVREGDLARGLGLLRDAKLRDSSNPDLRYHLAVALARSGREAEARAELKEIVTATASFEALDEARQLQRQLGP